MDLESSLGLQGICEPLRRNVNFNGRTFKFIYLLVIYYYYYYFIFKAFLERGREGEREGGKHQCVVASRKPPTGDLTYNPGMCPGWELNQRLFASQSGVQSTEPHQAGL